MTRSVLFTALLGFTFAACAAQAPVNGPSGDDDPNDPNPTNPNDPNDPSDPNPTDPNNPGGGGTAAAVVDKISTTECDQAHACKANFPAEFGDFADYFGATVDECYPINAEYWNADAVEAAIAGGTIMFDQAAADACLADAVTAPVCTTYWEEGGGIPESCFAAFTGTVAAGGACTTDFECSGENYCAGTCTAQ